MRCIVRYEEYFDDNHRYDRKAEFSCMDDVADWIFDQMANYDDYLVWTPLNTHVGVGYISFHPEQGKDVWIHMIEDDGRIHFTDGKHTAGQKHMSEDFKEFCRKISERSKNPKFVFAK